MNVSLSRVGSDGLYAAAKFALEGLSEALAQKLAPLGIRLTLVEPGAFRTEFLSSHSMRRSYRRIEDYDQTAAKTIDHLADIAGKPAGDPERGAKAILAAADAISRCYIWCLAQMHCAAREKNDHAHNRA